MNWSMIYDWACLINVHMLISANGEIVVLRFSNEVVCRMVISVILSNKSDFLQNNALMCTETDDSQIVCVVFARQNISQ